MGDGTDFTLLVFSNWSNPCSLSWISFGPWFWKICSGEKLSIVRFLQPASSSKVPIINEPTSFFVFFILVQDAGVTVLGTVPSLVKTWKNTDCIKGLDWTKIK